jgi:uncharacterized protein YcfL
MAKTWRRKKELYFHNLSIEVLVAERYKKTILLMGTELITLSANVDQRNSRTARMYLL